MTCGERSITARAAVMGWRMRGDAGDAAGGAVAAVHDGGVEFVAAFGGEHGAAARVEERIVFHVAG